VPPRVFVVPHTHWDREWYLPAAAFQLRLARLIDGVAALLDRDPEIPSFLLDGQAIVLEDYAAAREGGAATLSRLLRGGRLESGPWFVLPDELLVSAESLIRNLAEGRRVVARFGGRPLGVGYSPDAFGHSGALPALLAGFGIPAAVVWRGLGGPGQEGDLHRWRAPDGSEVLLVHLPASGYEYGANLPSGPAAAAERWKSLAALLGPRSRGPAWLLLNGADHHAPRDDLGAAIAALRKASGGADVRAARLEEYASAALEWAQGSAPLPVVEGELRGGWSHTWGLQDAQGSRLYLKQWNGWCQRMLERVAEPLAALASRQGRDQREELRLAWRALLENHAHDSICGTSHDAVHREMMTRFRRCAALAAECASHSLDAAIGHDPAHAREAGSASWRPALAVFNPAPRPRRAIVEAEVAMPLWRIPVGARSRSGRRAPRKEGRLVLRDAAGSELEVQELARRDGVLRTDSPCHYPYAEAVEWRRVLVRADLPPLGVALLPAGVRSGGATAARAGEETVEVSEAGLVNAALRARVEADGSFALVDRATGYAAHGLGALYDEADAGDSYTSSIRGGSAAALVPDAVAMRIVHRGPLRGEIEVLRRYGKADLELVTRLALDAGSRCVVVSVRGVNRRGARRLRLAFPLGSPCRRVLADAHFGPVERSAGHPRSPHGSLERPAATAPLQRWVALVGRGGALLAIGDALPQYEARRDGTLLVTVLRAFEELSLGDLPERPGHAGWPTSTPDARCLGPFAARLAVAPLSAGELDDPSRLDELADEVLAAPWSTMRRALVRRHADVAGPTLEGEGLAVSAVTPAGDGAGVVLRCYNTRAVPAAGSWRLPYPAQRAELCRLDETPIAEIPVLEGEVAFEAGPRAIVTIRIVWRASRPAPPRASPPGG
jgi:mannosylglycerate hydrolase